MRRRSHRFGFALAVVVAGCAVAEEPANEPDPKSVLAKHPAVQIHIVPVAKTDPDLAVDHRRHFAYIDPAVKRRDQLFLFLTGTHGTGADCADLNAVAAENGYHVLSLTYRTGVALAAFRESDDPDAFLKGRNNALYGENGLEPFTFSRAECIENRLIKALAWLDKEHPAEGWGQYLERDKPAWSKYAVCGLSQGGGYAALLGIQHRVARVIVFGGPKDNSLRLHKPAKWYHLAKATPLEAFFCFNHSLDEGHGCTYQEQLDNYRALGLLPKYAIADVDDARPPYHHTRLLTSHFPADQPKHNHGFVAGNRRYIDAWTYLMTEPVGDHPSAK